MCLGSEAVVDLFNSEDFEMPPASSGLRERLRAMMKHERYSRLLAELAKPHSPIQRLLLRHPDDLLPKLDPEAKLIPPEFSLSIPVLLWESSATERRAGTRRPTLLDYMEEDASEFTNESGASDEPDEDLGESDESTDFGDFQEVVLLNGLHVLQHNPHLLQLAEQSEPVTLPQLRKAMGTTGIDTKPLEDEFLRLMGNIAEDEGMGTIFRTLLVRSESDTESAYETKKMISEMYKYFRDLLGDLPILFGRIYGLLPKLAQKGAPFLRKHNAFVRRVYGMPSSEYLEAVNWLWESELIEPMIITLVCPRCKDTEGASASLVLSSEMSPKDLNSKPSCIWCGAPLKVDGFYGLDGWVQRCIHSQDRLLAYVVGFLLETSGKVRESRVQSPISEHDFHVTTPSGTHLIECKVFSCSAPLKNDPALRRKIRGGVSQLVSHMLETRVNSATLVCFPCPLSARAIDQLITTELKKRKADELREKVRVIGIHDLPRILTLMK